MLVLQVLRVTGTGLKKRGGLENIHVAVQHCLYENAHPHSHCLMWWQTHHFFWLHPQHAELPQPGIKSTPRQPPKLLQWQRRILNLLHHMGNPGSVFSASYWESFWTPKDWPRWPRMLGRAQEALAHLQRSWIFLPVEEPSVCQIPSVRSSVLWAANAATSSPPRPQGPHGIRWPTNFFLKNRTVVAKGEREGVG